MATIKTTQNDASVEKFIAAQPVEQIRRDSAALVELMQSATRCPAKMWGTGIIGFDVYRYAYSNGKPGETCLIGFAPRKSHLTLYAGAGEKENAELLPKLGKYKLSGGCLHFKSLEDLHLPTLKQLLKRSVKRRREQTA